MGGVKSDAWIRQQIKESGMIVPGVENLVSEKDGKKIISYGTTSYGYAARLAPSFRVFTTCLLKGC